MHMEKKFIIFISWKYKIIVNVHEQAVEIIQNWWISFELDQCADKCDKKNVEWNTM